jgi:hypothetical protein
VAGEDLLDVAVPGVGADDEVGAVGAAGRLPAGDEVGGARGQPGEDGVLAEQADGAGHRVAEVDPVQAVVEVVADVAEGDGAADAGDDRVGIGEALAAERDAAEGLDADELDGRIAAAQRLDEAARRRTGADAGDDRQRSQRGAGQGVGHEPGQVVVAEVVDGVVVLAHPVHVRVLGQQLLHPGDAAVLVKAQVVGRGHLVDGGSEDLELGPHGRRDRGRGDDVAAHPVAVAGQGQGQGVDPAGAVDERVAGCDRAVVEERLHRAQGGVDLERLEAGEDDVVGEPDERRRLDGVGHVRMDGHGGYGG